MKALTHLLLPCFAVRVLFGEKLKIYKYQTYLDNCGKVNYPNDIFL